MSKNHEAILRELAEGGIVFPVEIIADLPHKPD